LIFSASSIPQIVIAALSNRLNPASAGFVASLADGLLHQIIQVLAGSNLDAPRTFAVFLQLPHRTMRAA